ncbi:MAG TPA: MoaD/ThiS family protein [Verrucomicrobiae bacterium]|nr:MoaD/ThiS family protein [Verrucomicrobiae bacterium]
MNVLVKLYATFREGRFVSDRRQYSTGSAVADVLRELGIQEREIGVLLLNCRHVEAATSLQDGDSLSIFPLVGGG